MSYLIAAYAAVLLTLVVYGLRIQAQRRALLRRASSRGERAGG